MNPSKAEASRALSILKLGRDIGNRQVALLQTFIDNCPDEPAPPPTNPEGLVAGLRQVHERHLWAQPGDEPDRVFILRFSDPDCREQLFTGKDAEARAIEAWNLYSPNWNVYLFGTMPTLSPVSDADTVRVKREDLECVIRKIDLIRENPRDVIGHRIIFSVRQAVDRLRTSLNGGADV